MNEKNPVVPTTGFFVSFLILSISSLIMGIRNTIINSEYWKTLPVLTFVFFSCGDSKPTLDVTEAEIDAYVAEKLESDQIYDIHQGPRFSREVEEDLQSYEAVLYKQNDTLILSTEHEITATSETTRNIYFMQGLPVLVEEVKYTDAEIPVTDRKIYLNGADVIAAYERTGPTFEDAALKKYEKSDGSIDDLNIERAQMAVEQRGDYEMKFGEFLILPQSQYLILENKKSSYDVALLILQDDELINKMFQNPDSFQGKTLKFKFEFATFDNGGIRWEIFVC
jgi:hypothetical protein